MTDSPRVKLTDKLSVDIVDPNNVTPVFADLVTELRVVDGVLCLSLANLIVDGNDPTVRKAQICARLRVAGSTVQFIQQILASPDQPNDSSVPKGQTIQ